MIKCKRILCGLFAVLLLLGAASCGKADDGTVHGIPMTPDAEVEYAEATRAEARTVFTDFFTLYVSRSTALTPALRAQIDTHATAIEEVFAREKIAEEDYLAFFRAFAEKKETYADILSRLLDGETEKTDGENAGDLFALILASFPSDSFGRILYNVLLYQYDFEITRNLDRVEKYRQNLPALAERYQTKADEQTAERATLAGIGEDLFVPVCKNIFLLSACFFRRGESVSEAEFFSDAELAKLCKIPDFSLSLKPEEWELLFRYASRFGADKTGLLEAVLVEGDEEFLAADANDLFALCVLVQSSLSAETVSLWRAAENDALGYAVYATFGEGEKQLLRAIAGRKFSGATYREIIEGNDALSDFFDVPVLSVTDLDTQPREGFITALRGVLKGIFYDQAD